MGVVFGISMLSGQARLWPRGWPGSSWPWPGCQRPAPPALSPVTMRAERSGVLSVVDQFNGQTLPRPGGERSAPGRCSPGPSPEGRMSSLLVQCAQKKSHYSELDTTQINQDQLRSAKIKRDQPRTTKIQQSSQTQTRSTEIFVVVEV